MNITEMSLDDLLTTTVDRDQRAVNLVYKWADTQGYYPGATRVPAAELYTRFHEWATALDPQPAGIPSRTVWGKDMNQRFKRGRTGDHRFYYISRENLPERLEKIGLGG